jgi:hypothetical protein
LVYLARCGTVLSVNSIISKIKNKIYNQLQRRSKMLFKKAKLCTILLLGIGLTRLQAQEAIPASGGNASGSGGSASYTVGQLVYTTNTGTSGSVAQGVQQPFEISVITGLEEAKAITLQCSAYPNPANDYLTLKIEGELETQCVVYLYDINRKLIQSQKITGNETTIIMRNLVPATYFLKVIQGNKEVKTFKIIKK